MHDISAHAFPSIDCELCRSRWQVKLARRHDPDVYVLTHNDLELADLGGAGLYVILGVTFWFYPGIETLDTLNVKCT